MEASLDSQKISFEEWKFQDFCHSTVKLYFGLTAVCLTNFAVRLAVTGKLGASLVWGPLFYLIAYVIQNYQSWFRRFNLQAVGLLLHLVPSLLSCCAVNWSFKFDDRASQQMHKERMFCTEFSVWLAMFHYLGFKSSGVAELLWTHVPIIFCRWYFLYLCFGQSLDTSGLLVGMIVSLAVTYSCYVHDVQARSCFQSLSTARELMQTIKDADSSMQALTGCLFQASCICDAGGKLMHASVGMRRLYDPSANEPHSLLQILQDPQRVLHFFKMSFRSKSLRAESLLVSVRPSSEEANFEATLYCIPLPQERGLLVGMTTTEAQTSSDKLGYELTAVLDNAGQAVDTNDPAYLEWREIQCQARQRAFAPFSVVASFAMVVWIQASALNLDLKKAHGLALLCFFCCVRLRLFGGKRYNQPGLDCLQIAVCWCLHGLALCLSLDFSQVVVQHRFFIIFHYVFILLLPGMVDVSPKAYFITVPPVQMFCFFVFHKTIDWHPFQFHIMNLTATGLGCYYRRVSEKRVVHTYAGLQRERLAQANLRRHVETMERLRDSLFDGTCFCSQKSFDIESVSPLFTHSLGMDYVGSPFVVLGFSITDRIAISALLESTGDKESFVASKAKCFMNKMLLHSCVPCKVQLFAVAQPSMDFPAAGKRVTWVGIQLLDDIEHISDSGSRFQLPYRSVTASCSSSSSSVSPEDSVSVQFNRSRD